MSDYFYKLILTSLSVTCFGLMDRMKKMTVTVSSFGGALTFTAEYILLTKTENIFLVYFLSACITCLYSEIMARIIKTPVTVIMLPAIIPLVPGSLIYRAMKGLLEKNSSAYMSNLVEVLLSAGGIASAAALCGAAATLYKKLINFWLDKLRETKV